jgi:hypothetical protein
VPVNVGETKDDLIKINSGLKGNELVVTQRAYQLMAQGSKGAIPSDEEEGAEKSTSSKVKPESILFLTIGGVVLLLLGFLAGKFASRKDRSQRAQSAVTDKATVADMQGNYDQ